MDVPFLRLFSMTLYYKMQKILDACKKVETPQSNSLTIKCRHFLTYDLFEVCIALREVHAKRKNIGTIHILRKQVLVYFLTQNQSICTQHGSVCDPEKRKSKI